MPMEVTIHSPVPRPSTQPIVSAVTGIRSHYCFRVVGGERLAFRQLSCHCDHCLDGNWNDCECAEAGKWKVIEMKKLDGSSPARLRSQRERVSATRREMAKLCQAGEFVALESQDDERGFAFWLALVKGPAFRHTGRQEIKDGVQLKCNGWYVTVTMFDRFPESSSKTFQSCQYQWTVDAEALVGRNVVVKEIGSRHRTRSASEAPAVSVRMSEEEVKRIETLCAVRLN
jgi:hypothetical protein